MWVQLPVTKLWLHRLNLKWKWSQMPTLTNVQQTHMHRNYLCLASMSLSMPLRLREGDLHWKCDGNEAVATVSVTVSDNTYCKAPVYNHTQIVRPAWDTQPVICSIYCQSHWQGIKKWWRERVTFVRGATFLSFSSLMVSLNDHGDRCLHTHSFSHHQSLTAALT